MRVHPDQQYAVRQESLHTESGWPHAGRVRRLVAYLIDLVVVLLVFIVVLLIGGFVLGLMGIDIDTRRMPESDRTAISWLVFLASYMGYFVVRERQTGATVGKRLLGLRVLATSGQPASGTAIVVRNLVRPIDTVGGGLLAFVTPRRQRLGDKAAGTVVVRVQLLSSNA